VEQYRKHFYSISDDEKEIEGALAILSAFESAASQISGGAHAARIQAGTLRDAALKEPRFSASLSSRLKRAIIVAIDDFRLSGGD